MNFVFSCMSILNSWVTSRMTSYLSSVCTGGQFGKLICQYTACVIIMTHKPYGMVVLMLKLSVTLTAAYTKS